MTFQEFAKRLGGVIKAESNTHVFVRTLFESILPEDKYDILREYSDSTFKAYYNGNANISRIAKKVNMDAQAENFADFIHNYEDPTVQKISDAFSDVIPNIDCFNAGQMLGELFESIISESAAANKKSTPKGASASTYLPPIILDPNGKAPDLEIYQDGVLYFEKIGEPEDEEIKPFKKYLTEASAYYSTKKTLLYAEDPHPFYDLYVCNDIRCKKFRTAGAHDYNGEKTISGASVELLEAESKYIIIEGIGGIGKSMFLTHLFLSSAQKSEINGTIPLFLSLKEYKDTTCGIVDFIWKSVKEYDNSISLKDIIDTLQNKKMILLLDGLDEIQSSIRNSFDQDLEAFIKSYFGNTIIMTSRPVYSFISYSKFSLFDIQALTKKQALELVQKLEFWDLPAKNSFLEALDKHLYYSHRQFASNPLLLTIMLMTYSSFGEVPAKMHVFYSKAYETMARLHDASKGSFKRPLNTDLTPEEFAKYFAQFCARTYKDEKLEFDSMSFSLYMSKVLKKAASVAHHDITPRDFLMDLTNNLCIMYREGEKYYFIHRSFQEYFAALHFASEYDAKLTKVGFFFETMKNRFYADRTFDMLYDMIPEKTERFIFLPFLEGLITNCEKKNDEYWEFLERIYPVIYHEDGLTGESHFNAASSFIYKKIIKEMSLDCVLDSESYKWPKQIYDLPAKTWVEAYTEFLNYSAYDRYPNPEFIPDELLDNTDLADESELPYKYTEYFGNPDPAGIEIAVEIHELRQNPHRYKDLRACIEQDNFPLKKEYQNIKRYYANLRERTNREIENDDLFDD